jgi:hypothetical protein
MMHNERLICNLGGVRGVHLCGSIRSVHIEKYYVDYGRNFDFSHRYVPTTALELAQLGGKLLRMVDNQLPVVNLRVKNHHAECMVSSQTIENKIFHAPGSGLGAQQ